MKLYQLFTQDKDGLWHPQFSDRDRAVVAQEAADSYSDIAKARRVILKLADDSAASSEYAQRMLNKHGRNIRVA
jgi:hypothetical protein